MKLRHVSLGVVGVGGQRLKIVYGLLSMGVGPRRRPLGWGNRRARIQRLAEICPRPHEIARPEHHGTTSKVLLLLLAFRGTLSANSIRKQQSGEDYRYLGLDPALVERPVGCLDVGW